MSDTRTPGCYVDLKNYDLNWELMKLLLTDGLACLCCPLMLITRLDFEYRQEEGILHKLILLIFMMPKLSSKVTTGCLWVINLYRVHRWPAQNIKAVDRSMTPYSVNVNAHFFYWHTAVDMQYARTSKAEVGETQTCSTDFSFLIPHKPHQCCSCDRCALLVSNWQLEFRKLRNQGVVCEGILWGLTYHTRRACNICMWSVKGRYALHAKVWCKSTIW